MTSKQVQIQKDAYDSLKFLRDKYNLRSFTETIWFLLNDSATYHTQFQELVKRVEKLEAIYK